MCPEAVSFFEGSSFKAGALSLKPEVLHTLDSLYAFYHRQWWCYSHMYRAFKLRQALLNGAALLVVAAGMIAGSICENSVMVTCLAAWGTLRLLSQSVTFDEEISLVHQNHLQHS